MARCLLAHRLCASTVGQGRGILKRNGCRAMAEIEYDALIKKIRQLPVRLGNKAGRRARRKGGNVIREQARNHAKRGDDPESANSIWKNITVAGGGRRRERQRGGAMMRVGIRGGARNMSKYGEFRGKGKGNPGGDTWYWRLIEFGFVHWKTGRHIPPRPFTQDATKTKASAPLAAVGIGRAS